MLFQEILGQKMKEMPQNLLTLIDKKWMPGGQDYSELKLLAEELAQTKKTNF
jgi:hypothetical protein